MLLEPNSSYVNLDDYRPNSIWDIVDTTVKRQEHLGGDTLKFYIRLRRKPLYFMFNIGAPVIILSALTVLTFCLPNEGGEKLGFVATVFLSFMVFTAQIASSLPSSSDTIPLLGMYAFVSLIYAALANVAAVAVLAVHNTAPGEQPHALLMVLLRLLTCSCCKSVRKTHCSTAVITSSEAPTTNGSDGNLKRNSRSGYNDWSKMAAKLDTLLFWLFLVSNLVTVIVFFAIIPNVNRSDIDSDWVNNNNN